MHDESLLRVQVQTILQQMESQSQHQVSNSAQQPNRGTSFFKTCFNGLNALSGIGILSMPYAISQGGWLGVILLLVVATLYWYTGLLLQRCMDEHPRIKSYPDIGEVAFGYKGRAAIAILMYLELFLVAVEFLILEGDNLEKLFPNMNIKTAVFQIGGKSCFVLLTGLVILPTTWLRNLGVLSYISLAGVLAPFILIGCVLWVGEVDGVGFHERGQLVNWGGLPTTVSLFAFSFSAHAVFPMLRNSMEDKSQFYKVLLFCYVISTITYGSLAIIGYLMFGDYLKSQVTLNLPTNKISTKIAIYTTLISPITKYAIIITPIANAIESTKFFDNRKAIAILIRTTIVGSTVLVAIFVPFFGYIMAFIGAFLSVTAALLLPCLCYLKIKKAARRFGLELVIIIGILLIGLFIGILGTFTSVKQIVNHLK